MCAVSVRDCLSVMVSNHCYKCVHHGGAWYFLPRGTSAWFSGRVETWKAIALLGGACPSCVVFVQSIRQAPPFKPHSLNSDDMTSSSTVILRNYALYSRCSRSLVQLRGRTVDALGSIDGKYGKGQIALHATLHDTTYCGLFHNLLQTCLRHLQQVHNKSITSPVMLERSC